MTVHLTPANTDQLRVRIDPAVRTYDSLKCEIERQRQDDPFSDVSALLSAQEQLKVAVTKEAMNFCRAQGKMIIITQSIEASLDVRLPREEAERLIEAYLDTEKPDYPTFTLIEDGETG